MSSRCEVLRIMEWGRTRIFANHRIGQYTQPVIGVRPRKQSALMNVRSNRVAELARHAGVGVQRSLRCRLSGSLVWPHQLPCCPTASILEAAVHVKFRDDSQRQHLTRCCRRSTLPSDGTAVDTCRRTNAPWGGRSEAAADRRRHGYPTFTNALSEILTVRSDRG